LPSADFPKLACPGFTEFVIDNLIVNTAINNACEMHLHVVVADTSREVSVCDRLGHNLNSVETPRDCVDHTEFGHFTLPFVSIEATLACYI
jgi:hypothetical protein